MTNNFHNTIKLKGKSLAMANSSAKAQQDLIMEFFKSNPDKSFSPPAIQILVGLTDAPLTSVRRAISNLTKAGNLVNTYDTEVGPYGKPNFLWRLNTVKHPMDTKQLELFNHGN